MTIKLRNDIPPEYLDCHIGTVEYVGKEYVRFSGKLVVHISFFPDHVKAGEEYMIVEDGQGNVLKAELIERV